MKLTSRESTSPFKLLVKDILEMHPPIIMHAALGFPPQLDEDTTHFVTGHGEVKMALSGKLLSQWLTFLVYGKVLYRVLRDKSHQ